MLIRIVWGIGIDFWRSIRVLKTACGIPRFKTEDDDDEEEDDEGVDDVDDVDDDMTLADSVDVWFC